MLSALSLITGTINKESLLSGKNPCTRHPVMDITRKYASFFKQFFNFLVVIPSKPIYLANFGLIDLCLLNNTLRNIAISGNPTDSTIKYG